MSELKLPAASGGGSISIKGPSSSSADLDLLDTSGHLNLADSKQLNIGTGDDLVLKHDGSNSYLTNTTGNLILKDTTGQIFLQSTVVNIESEDGEAQAKFTADAGVELYHNNLKKIETTSTGVTVTGSIWCGTNGTGISFESSNNNGQGGTSILFDDYEEGTWTPGWGGWSNVTYDSRSGRFTKIGRIVHATCHINTGSSSTNTSGGHVHITGLPFTVANQNAAEGGATIGLSNIMRSSTEDPVPMINLSANTTSAYFYHSNGTAYSDSHMSGADGHIRVTFIYEAA